MSFDTGLNVRTRARATDFGQQLRGNIKANREIGNDPARGGLERLAQHILDSGRQTRALRVTNTTNHNDLAFEFKRFGYKNYRVERTAEMLKAYLEADGLAPERASGIVDGVLRTSPSGRYRVATGQDILDIRHQASEAMAAQFQRVVDVEQMPVREDTSFPDEDSDLQIQPVWPPTSSHVNDALEVQGYVVDQQRLGAGTFGDVHRLTGPSSEPLVLKYLVDPRTRRISPEVLSFNRSRDARPNEAMAAYLSQSGSQPGWQPGRALVAPSHYLVARPGSDGLEMIAASELKARIRNADGPMYCVAEIAPAVNGGDLAADLKDGNTQGQAFIRQHMPEFARSFLGTLRQLNERGIVHRDIKLENIMREGTELRLIDWGMMYKVRKAKSGEAPKQQALPIHFLGSPGYVHPKIRQGVGTQNDLHAWGITMLRMLDPGVTGAMIRGLGKDESKGRAATFADIRERLQTVRDGAKFSKASRDRAAEALNGFDDPNSMFNLARQCLEAADTTRPGYSAVEWMNRDYSRGEYDRLLSHPALHAGEQAMNPGALA